MVINPRIKLAVQTSWDESKQGNAKKPGCKGFKEKQRKCNRKLRTLRKTLQSVSSGEKHEILQHVISCYTLHCPFFCLIGSGAVEDRTGSDT